MRVVFFLTSGRSGTAFLAGCLGRSLPDAVVRHEPYWDVGNPTMFGRPIYDHAVGDRDAVRRRLEVKRRWVSRVAPRAYVETSHAFLKSYWDLAPEYFPGMRVVHVVRNPLEVARSEANREELIERVRLPLRRYRGGDGRRYFRWALTGREAIFRPFDGMALSPFQRYLIQWIEIENRATVFLDRFDMWDACFTVHTPGELRQPARLEALVRFVHGDSSAPPLVMSDVRNRTPGRPTVVGTREEAELESVVDRMTSDRLRIFSKPPYAGLAWAGRLCASQSS